MVIISSHQASKMRVLIVCALLACASAAPQIIPLPGLQPVVVVSPNVPAGDLQAAAINAQVRAEDQARALADQARELAEQAVENQNEGIIEGTDLAKERNEEAFWATEDKKWQMYDAARTAEAAIGGALASNDARSLNVVAGIVPIPNPSVPAAPETPAVEAQAEVKDASVKSEQPTEKPVEANTAEVKKESVEETKDTVEIKSAAVDAAPEPVSQAAQKIENVDVNAYRALVQPLAVDFVPFPYQPAVIPNIDYYQRAVRGFYPGFAPATTFYQSY